MNILKIYFRFSGSWNNFYIVRHYSFLKKIEEEQCMPIFQYATPNTKPAQRIYVWGSSLTGALGVKTFLRPPAKFPIRKVVNRPYKLPFLDTFKFHIKSIACGYGFTILVSDGKTKHKLFGTGINTDSQIGYHETRRGSQKSLNCVFEPVPINIPLIKNDTKVTHAACGRAHTILLTDQEGVFSLGNNAYGQCGRSVVENEKYSDNPRVNKVSIDFTVRHIICGQDHSIFLTDNGAVYSCGCGSDGQTGLGHYKIQSHPTLVEGDIKYEKISYISCSTDLVLAVSEKGDVFGWGNSEYKQLGFITEDLQVNVPRHLPFKDVGKVVKVASGGTICALLSSDGEVFVWGYGVLGKGPEYYQSSLPSKIPMTLFGRNEFNPDVLVTDINCGLRHFTACTNKGDLFTWGQNSTGCLGLGHENDQFFPLKVSLPAHVKNVACGVDHTVALCNSFI